MLKISKAILRETPCALELEISIMTQLRNEDLRDIELWLEEWQRTTMLPDKYRDVVQKYLVELMKPIKFCKKSAHRLFNESFTRSIGGGVKEHAIGVSPSPSGSRWVLYKRGVRLDLGRLAGWFGVRTYIRAMKRSRKDDPLEKQLVTAMVACLLHETREGKNLLRRTDHDLFMTVFEKDFEGDSPESLVKWLYKVA